MAWPHQGVNATFRHHWSLWLPGLNWLGVVETVEPILLLLVQPAALLVCILHTCVLYALHDAALVTA